MVLEAVDSRLRDVFAAYPHMACIITRSDEAPVVELSTGNARPDILVKVTEDGPETPSLLCVSWLGHEVLAQCERADVACGIVGAMLAHDLGLPATCAQHGDNLPCPGCLAESTREHGMRCPAVTGGDAGDCECGA